MWIQRNLSSRTTPIVPDLIDEQSVPTLIPEGVFYYFLLLFRNWQITVVLATTNLP